MNIQAAVVGESLGMKALQAQHRLLAAGGAEGGSGSGYSEALGGKGQNSGGRGRGSSGGKGGSRRRGSMGVGMGTVSSSSSSGGGGGGGVADEQNEAAEVRRGYFCFCLRLIVNWLFGCSLLVNIAGL